MSRDHRQLRVFHQANDLVISVYRHTANLPPEERFGLQAQMRRSAVSTATNIVEGSARRSEKEYLQFIHMALGSATECHYLLGLCVDLGFLSKAPLASTLDQADHLVRSLQRLADGVRPAEAGSRKPEAE